MSLNIGDKAPSFTLKDTDLQDASLENYAGKTVVLVFFPMAFTSVCTDGLCYMRDNLSKYDSLNAQVLALSVDSPFTLKKFKEENNLNFPVLSDFNKQVSQAYGAYYEEFVLGLQGVSKRAVFVINGDGKIQYQEILENAGNLPNFERLEQEVSINN